MNSFKNIGTQDYFKRYGIRYGILRALFTKFPFHYISDYENRKLLYYKKIKKKILKIFNKSCDEDPEGLIYGDCRIENPIWVYWKQGEEKMPDIVRACVKSIRENSSRTVILLTDNNIENYIKFPKYITDRFADGTMSAAALSDLLRFSLLEHFGGTWVDATVYLTDKLPNYITESGLFAFRETFGLIENPAIMSVWFLHSKKGNQIIRETRNVSFYYWKMHKYVMEYLTSNIILTFAMEKNQKYSEKVPYASSEYCRLLFSNIGEKYDEKIFAHIKELSQVHKLSYKLKENVFTDSENFYHKICNYIDNGDFKK